MEGVWVSPVAAPPRVWDRGAGCSTPPRTRTPRAAPSWSQRDGFGAGKGCGQTGSEERLWVGSGCSLLTKPPRFATYNFFGVSSWPSTFYSGTRLAGRLWGRRGVGAHFNCLGDGSNLFCGWRNVQGVFPLLSLPFEQRNLERFRTGARHTATLCAAGPLGWSIAHGTGCPSPARGCFGEKICPFVGSECFLGRVEWTRGDRGSP